MTAPKIFGVPQKNPKNFWGGHVGVKMTPQKFLGFFLGHPKNFWGGHGGPRKFFWGFWFEIFGVAPKIFGVPQKSRGTNFWGAPKTPKIFGVPQKNPKNFWGAPKKPQKFLGCPKKTPKIFGAPQKFVPRDFWGTPKIFGDPKNFEPKPQKKFSRPP